VSGAGRRFRVISYNIHKGFTVGNRGFVLEGIRDAVRAMRPDFVFLQEVVGEHNGHRARLPHWPEEPQCEYVAGALFPHFAYGRNAVYADGHHGNAILSKYPILSWENEDVSTSTLERRGILHAVVKPGEGEEPVHLICAHLGLLERDRQVQGLRLCERLTRSVGHEEPLIVAGDFNDWRLRMSPLLQRRAGLVEAYHSRHRHHARTFPARFPLFRLDRVYFRGPGLRAVRAKCLRGEPWAKLSDHAPLLVDFELTSSRAHCNSITHD
jgi:endonuclease/exonuclease/phosphatase family metal-dependent hydrolase